MTGKDGNFALLSASFEPPTGNKDYAPFHGPVNYIFAGMTGVEWRRYSIVGLGYYRINTADSTGSKKGNNWLAALGFAYTPVDERTRLFSVQFGVASEIHEKDRNAGATVDPSGGWEVFASPTIVWSAGAHWRSFTYVSFPVAQSCEAASQEDR